MEVKDDKITEGQENFEPTQTFIIIQKWEMKENRIRFIFSTFWGFEIQNYAVLYYHGILKTVYIIPQQIALDLFYLLATQFL